MTIFAFIAAAIWGSLSALFLVHALTSLIVALIFLGGLSFSNVSRSSNAAGVGTALAKAIIFATVFVVGSWTIGDQLDLTSWNINSVASLVSFLATTVYIARHIPGQVYLAKMAAWHPTFSEAATYLLKHEGNNFALKQRATLLDPARRAVVKPLPTTKHGIISETAIPSTRPSALKEQDAGTN